MEAAVPSCQILGGYVTLMAEVQMYETIRIKMVLLKYFHMLKLYSESTELDPRMKMISEYCLTEQWLQLNMITCQQCRPFYVPPIHEPSKK